MKKWKTPIGLVTNKLIIYLNGLNISNLPRQIDNPKYTALATVTITLDDMFRHYFKDSFMKMLYVETFPQLILKQ